MPLFEDHFALLVLDLQLDFGGQILGPDIKLEAQFQLLLGTVAIGSRGKDIKNEIENSVINTTT